MVPGMNLGTVVSVSLSALVCLCLCKSLGGGVASAKMLRLLLSWPFFLLVSCILELRDPGVIQSRGHRKSVCLLHSALPSQPLPCLSRTTPTVKVTRPERCPCKQGRRCRRAASTLAALGGRGPAWVCVHRRNNTVMMDASSPVCPGSLFLCLC